MIELAAVDGIDIKRLTDIVRAVLLLQRRSRKAGSAAASSASACAQVQQTLELLLEVRHLCASYLSAAPEDMARARDVLYLDLALASSVRTTVEGHLDAFAASAADMRGDRGALLHYSVVHTEASLAVAHPMRTSANWRSGCSRIWWNHDRHYAIVYSAGDSRMAAHVAQTLGPRDRKLLPAPP